MWNKSSTSTDRTARADGQAGGFWQYLCSPACCCAYCMMNPAYQSLSTQPKIRARLAPTYRTVLVRYYGE